MKQIPLFIYIFVLVNIGSAVILFSPAKKEWVQSHIVSRNQTILSVIEGDLKNNGSFIKVVKLKTTKGIVLEFYSAVQHNGTRFLINRILLDNVQDGFFNYRGKAVQLAIVDLDGDGKMELLAPTFDKNMLAQLNPYYYSVNSKSFVQFYYGKLSSTNY